jgi:alkylation response protein AidB-like acyl-CoA dehydrogenase
MLDLDFTDEQEMLREAVRALCAGACPLTRVRELEDDPVGYDAGFWQQLAQLDLVGLLVPEAYGGSGMTALEGVVLYEELGRSLAPSPHFVSAVMAAGSIARAGTDEQKQAWLPGIARGESILSVAWLEPGNGFSSRGVDVRATAEGDGFRLSGTKWHVPFASSADRLVVLARTGEGDSDIDLFLVDPAADGVRLEQQLSLASDTQYAVTLEDAVVAASDRIGAAGTGWETWNEVMLDGSILLAALAVGGARYTLDITVQYAKDRQQFDKPLGAFQALAHYLADAATDVDGAETLVHEAAWARAEGREVERLAPMAKLFACQTFRDVTATAQQIFGGVGFTVEYDVQLFFRRAKQLQISWWDTRYCEELVARTILDAPQLVV